MGADFYLSDRRALAQYFEKDWFDHALAQDCVPAFEFTPFDPLRFYCDSHEKVSAFLAGAILDRNLAPQRLLGCCQLNEIEPGRDPDGQTFRLLLLKPTQRTIEISAFDDAPISGGGDPRETDSE